jgi:hypothetical protein
VNQNRPFKVNKFIVSAALFSGSLLAGHAQAQSLGPLFPGSGVSSCPSDLPSALWPTFVEASNPLNVGKDQVIIAKGSRGTLLRAEACHLVVDFGRYGVHIVEPESTNFYELASELMTGERQKEFPNFALQVGNKIMTFGRGAESGAIRFDEVKNTEVYVLLYLDSYHPEIAQDLLDFGISYQKLKENWPSIEVILMPKDHDFYDFGYTTGYSIPFIATHMRIGYRQTLNHGVDIGPGFVAVDPNGRILGRSEEPLEWNQLSEALRKLLNEIGVSWNSEE